jgi:uncharacterized membrane-anchored protein
MADSSQMMIDEIEKSLTYKTGIIELEAGNGKLTVPEGFRYLDKKQSIFIVTDMWGNPVDSSILGMIVPNNRGLLEKNSWAFIIRFDDIGYVKDDDADDIDYDELLKDLKKETDEANPERIKNGYEAIHFIGWASKPYYDKSQKTLHWAKEVKFGDSSSPTLNYNLRILGRKGVYILNAVAGMEDLEEVKTHINKIIQSVAYNEGNKYADFSPDVDQVAAWTIGGLVAGKILAKVGFFAIFLKFWKLIALAVVGFFGGIVKFFKRKQPENEVLPESTAEETTKAEE